MKRRQFLSSSAALASLPFISPDVCHALTTGGIETLMQQAAADDGVADRAAFEYWTTYARRIERYPGKGVRSRDEAKKKATGERTYSVKSATPELGGRSAVEENVQRLSGQLEELEAAAPIVDAKKPTFVIHTQPHGFREVNEIEDSELIDKGDVDVTVLVNTLRPSSADIGLLQDAVGGSLKLDFGQKETPPLPPLQDALAWSSIGVLSATTAGKKLPKLDALKLESSTGTLFGTAQTVPLVGGSGQWKWSFYVQKKESSWLKALKFIGSFGKVAGPVTPAVFAALGLPAIAWTALSTIDSLFAYFHAKEVASDWLYQGLQTPVVATQDARGLGAIPLRKGLNQYLVVPREHTPKLEQQKASLEVSKNGFLVPKNTPVLAAPGEALKTATDITYISMTVDVKSRQTKK